MSVHLRRCVNTSCRVETFLATWPLPFGNCPLCNQTGTAVGEPS